MSGTTTPPPPPVIAPDVTATTNFSLGPITLPDISLPPINLPQLPPINLPQLPTPGEILNDIANKIATVSQAVLSVIANDPVLGPIFNAVANDIDSGNLGAILPDIGNAITKFVTSPAASVKAVVDQDIQTANTVLDTVTGIDTSDTVQAFEDEVNNFIDDHADQIDSVEEYAAVAAMTASGVPPNVAMAVAALAADLIKNHGQLDPATIGSVLGNAITGPVGGALGAAVIQSASTGKFDLSSAKQALTSAVLSQVSANLPAVTDSLETQFGTQLGSTLGGTVNALVTSSLNQIATTGSIDVNSLKQTAVQGVTGAAQQYGNDQLAKIGYDPSIATQDYINQAKMTAQSVITDSHLSPSNVLPPDILNAVNTVNTVLGSTGTAVPNFNPFVANGIQTLISSTDAGTIKNKLSQPFFLSSNGADYSLAPQPNSPIYAITADTATKSPTGITYNFLVTRGGDLSAPFSMPYTITPTGSPKLPATEFAGGLTGEAVFAPGSNLAQVAVTVKDTNPTAADQFRVTLNARDQFYANTTASPPVGTTWGGEGGPFVLGEAQFVDLNGDGKKDLIFQGIDNRFFGSLSKGDTFGGAQLWATEPGPFNIGEARYADVNGDGKTDLIYQTTDNNFFLSLSDGTTFLPPVLAASQGGPFNVGEAQYADVNGDGKADQIYQGIDNRFFVSLSKGDTFGGALLWGSQGGPFNIGEAQYADVNGDGKADEIYQGIDNRFFVSLSDGTKFGDAQLAAAEGGPFNIGEAQYADVNGDGKADLIYQGIDNRFFVDLSNGTTFGGAQLWATEPGAFAVGEAQYSDVNGDGKADLVYQAPDNQVRVNLSTGTSFGPPIVIGQFAPTDPSTPTYKSPIERQLNLADVSGDGKADIIFQTKTNNFDVAQSGIDFAQTPGVQTNTVVAPIPATPPVPPPPPVPTPVPVVIPTPTATPAPTLAPAPAPTPMSTTSGAMALADFQTMNGVANLAATGDTIGSTSMSFGNTQDTIFASPSIMLPFNTN